MYLDGTGRVITTGQPVIFLGVIDQGQSYHNVVAGISGSENAPQCRKVVATTFEHADMIRAREDENEGRATPREPIRSTGLARTTAIHCRSQWRKRPASP